MGPNVVVMCLRWLDDLTIRPTHCDQTGQVTEVATFITQLLEAFKLLDTTLEGLFHGKNILLHLYTNEVLGDLGQYGLTHIRALDKKEPRSLVNGRDRAQVEHAVTILAVLSSLLNIRPQHRVKNIDVEAFLVLIYGTASNYHNYHAGLSETEAVTVPASAFLPISEAAIAALTSLLQWASSGSAAPGAPGGGGVDEEVVKLTRHRESRQGVIQQALIHRGGLNKDQCSVACMDLLRTLTVPGFVMDHLPRSDGSPQWVHRGSDIRTHRLPELASLRLYLTYRDQKTGRLYSHWARIQTLEQGTVDDFLRFLLWTHPLVLFKEFRKEIRVELTSEPPRPVQHSLEFSSVLLLIGQIRREGTKTYIHITLPDFSRGHSGIPGGGLGKEGLRLPSPTLPPLSCPAVEAVWTHMPDLSGVSGSSLQMVRSLPL